MDELTVNNQLVLEKIINKINNNFVNAQAYLLIGERKLELEKYAILLSKALICPKNYLDKCSICNICKRIDDGNYGELKIVEPVNKVIKKEAIIDLRSSFQTSSIEGKNQVYIVKDAETLNSAAANAILKFLEEPDSNTVAIFTSTNLGAVMETIISRCQVIKMNNINTKEKLELVYELSGLTSEEVNKVVEAFIKIEKNPLLALCSVNNLVLMDFSTRDLLRSFLNVLMLIYKDLFNYKFFGKFKYFDDDNRLIEIASKEEVNKIIKKISFILENIEKLDYNVNILLFMDNLLIGIGAINDDKSDRS